MVKVIDADTYDVDLDLGFHIHVQQRIRLEGLNAPEKNTPAGKTAIAWAQAWLAQRRDFVVETHRQEKYGRWLATLTADGRHSLNTALLDEGHAAPYDGTGPRPLPPTKENAS
ncbi:thermonuclease family protein [Streptomyces sp. NPDC087440]|uniref:thermonuclease family protein n=1 Tax=Streptomyces sp. NPDC087440 TaxID=3365790 RepID=UPI003811BA99